ncbi:ABC-2 type transport system ATP-binding protein [Acetoanaerobium noterae]|jgi:ABC-2 type transport system ATP-binding protein|uniref:ABC-2 type transport system ATP-binding protein n=1 Tax=Acetoanaerobium noterae TaxID=745369 RepID=A0A1T5D2Q8_9FIRM|nr:MULTISPECIES: ABC transporter ATP-binding protein [Acetoanaerobium]MBP8762520.1 ABC transporter ATP-binding protein [Acetoanaerobium sp.]MBP9499786.1 ABC transporter ATP-binding protein [Acetoanaerobium sp.]MBP9562225.1 ABC transporter ATP-binding protein [Acetoanaerobium sp.]SKB65780.1 ABC-2 type transport system ATP-binding protein [Acetoanaerobium noterae]
MTNNYLLEFSNITKKYGSKVALDNVSFNLEPGKIIGLLGPNGSGKSTILKLVNGLLQPTEGEIKIMGNPPGIMSKSIISYLPERTYLNEWMKISDLINFFADFYIDFDINKANEMVIALKLDPNHKLKTLSKGNKEKVQLILVMSRKAKLYLLDEPIGGVDPATRDFILDTIISNYLSDATLMISTHLISDIERIFDEVILINQGTIYKHDSVDNIRQQTGKSVDQLFREVFKC